MKKLMISCLLASLMVSPLGVLASENAVIVDKSITVDGDTSLVPEGELSSIKDTKGSISIKLADTKNNLPKNDVEFNVVKVACVEDGLYVLDSKYDDCDIDLNSIDSANELELAANILSKVPNNQGVSLKTDDDGVCSVGNLSVGVYLVYTVNTNKYEYVIPFLVSVPTWSSKSVDMVYDIEVLPKHSPKPDKDKDKDSPDDAFDSKALEFGLLSVGCLVVAGGLCIVSKKFSKV